MTREEFEAMWAVMHRECDKIGMAVISGHTGRYEGCEYPMIGGATVIGIGPKDRYVTPDMARLGDIVILTGRGRPRSRRPGCSPSPSPTAW